MKRTDALAMFLEGLFLGIACLLIYLVFNDTKAKDPWTKKEMALAGIALGLAVGGFWVETTLG